MRTRYALVILTTLSLGVPPGLVAQTPAPPSPPAPTTAPNIPGVVVGGTAIEVIKDGFQGTEGPITLPDGSLIFTETNASRITRIDENNQTSTFLENTNGSNSLAFDVAGRLLSVQTTPGQTKIGVIYPKGSEAVLADNVDGRPIGRPNDLTVDKRGGVYFTDPGAGRPAGAPEPAQPPLPPAVYYIAPGGKAVKVIDDIERPNGVLLSGDEKTLFVANTNGEHVLAYDVQANGLLAGRRNFGTLEGATKSATGVVSGADGLAIDTEGRLYVATTVGVQVFDSKGAHLGTLPFSRAPQNLAFAGKDKKTLYVVGRGVAFKVRMTAQGFMGRPK